MLKIIGFDQNCYHNNFLCPYYVFTPITGKLTPILVWCEFGQIGSVVLTLELTYGLTQTFSENHFVESGYYPNTDNIMATESSKSISYDYFTLL